MYWRPAFLPYYLEVTVENLREEWKYPALIPVTQLDIRDDAVRFCCCFCNFSAQQLAYFHQQASKVPLFIHWAVSKPHHILAHPHLTFTVHRIQTTPCHKPSESSVDVNITRGPSLVGALL